VTIARWNLKEGGGKPLLRRTEITINRKDVNGRRKPLWKSTGLKAIEKNKKEAESRCLSARIKYSVDLKNGVTDLSHEHKEQTDDEFRNDPLFADWLTEWLAFIHPSNVVIGEDFNFDKPIKINTWAGYAGNIKHNLYPTFKAYGCTVQEVTPELLKGFYSKRLKSGLKKASVAKDYTIINQVLNYAISRKLISINPNSAITLHKIEKYNAATLNAEQMQYYLEFIQGGIIEIPILLGGFYGMNSVNIKMALHKKGKSLQSLVIAGFILAERVGFEPTVP